MFVLITYDVNTQDFEGEKRLRRISKTCKNYGQRVQLSVFECIVDPARWTMLRDKLIAEMDQRRDSLRFYYLGSNWKHRVEHVGAKPSIDQEGPLVF